jgi:hypothetical protein
MRTVQCGSIRFHEAGPQNLCAGRHQPGAACQSLPHLRGRYIERANRIMRGDIPAIEYSVRAGYRFRSVTGKEMYQPANRHQTAGSGTSSPYPLRGRKRLIILVPDRFRVSAIIRYGVKPSSAVSVKQIHIAGQAGAIEPGHEGATRSLRRVMNPSRSVPRKRPKPYLEHMSSKLRCISKCGAISLDYLSRIY